jgi:hypothetical protein
MSVSPLEQDFGELRLGANGLEVAGLAQTDKVVATEADERFGGGDCEIHCNSR